mmetsp:Transcript_15999/g.31341  ORF Transcript_15999/g.31341 Transcript_15999/m.31341 type:complete len:87 (-) Transcript_15999:192-452(-)
MEIESNEEAREKLHMLFLRVLIFFVSLQITILAPVLSFCSTSCLSGLSRFDPLWELRRRRASLMCSEVRAPSDSFAFVAHTVPRGA